MKYFMQGDIKAAYNDFKKALELNKQFAMAYNNMGVILATQKRYEDALAMYAKAIEINPQFGMAYYHQAAAQEMLRKFDESCESLVKARACGVDVPASYTAGCN